MIDFAFTPEEEQFRQDVRAFLKEEVPPSLVSGTAGEVDNERDWAKSREITRKLGARRWLSVSWPKAYGGEDNITKHLIMNEEFSFREAPGIDPIGVNMVAPAIIEHGTEEQKTTFLPAIASGEAVWCQGFSEPSAGSELANVSTRAVERDGEFIINGQKIWTSNAHRANHILLLTRTSSDGPKQKGLSMFVIDVGLPGIAIRPLENMANLLSFNEEFFDDVHVPARNLLGKKGDGWAVAMSVLGFERSGIQRIAGARKHLTRLLAFARETGRIQNPLVRQRLADLLVEGEVATLLAYRVSWMQSRGMTVVHEPSMARVFGAEYAQRVARAGMKLFGQLGQLKDGSKWCQEGKIAKEYLVGFGATLGAGTSEMQRNIIAVRGLGLPRYA